MIKALLYAPPLFLYNYVYYRLLYKNIWNLKQNCKSFAYNKYLQRVWYIKLALKGSWIGHNTQFDGIPCFPHGEVGIFISGGAKIGRNVIIFQQVTIGSNNILGSNSGSPTIGENCYIGAGAKIIGNITIGKNCRIGANACVYTDMPDNSVAVCQKTRIIQKENLDNRYFTYKNGHSYYYNDGEMVLYK